MTLVNADALIISSETKTPIPEGKELPESRIIEGSATLESRPNQEAESHIQEKITQESAENVQKEAESSAEVENTDDYGNPKPIPEKKYSEEELRERINKAVRERLHERGLHNQQQQQQQAQQSAQPGEQVDGDWQTELKKFINSTLEERDVYSQ